MKKAIKKAIDTLKLEGESINRFLFGTPTTEMIEKGIRTLFPSQGEDIRQKTELTGRDVRACLYLRLVGKWFSKPFGDVSQEFMHLQVSRGRMGRTELAAILVMGNMLESLPKEAISKLVVKPQSGVVQSGQETKS